MSGFSNFFDYAWWEVIDLKQYIRCNNILKIYVVHVTDYILSICLIFEYLNLLNFRKYIFPTFCFLFLVGSKYSPKIWWVQTVEVIFKCQISVKYFERTRFILLLKRHDLSSWMTAGTKSRQILPRCSLQETKFSFWCENLIVTYRVA